MNDAPRAEPSCAGIGRRRLPLLAGLLGAGLVAGCGVTPSRTATCHVETYTRFDLDERPLPMLATSDGSWCSFAAYGAFASGDMPGVGGIVVEAPRNGTARMENEGDATVAAYMARPGYVGTDRFTVAFELPNIILPVTVTVRAPSPTVPAPAAGDPGTPQNPYQVPVMDRRAGGSGSR